MTYIGFPISALIYASIFLFLYYSKKRINLFENKVVMLMMIINIIGLLLELSCYFVISFWKISDTHLGMIILKSYIEYILIFNWLLNGYVFVVTNKNYGDSKYNMKKYYQKNLLIFSPFVLLITGIVYLAPLNYYNIFPKYYTYGLAVDVLALSFVLLAPIWLFRCLKVIFDKKSTKKMNIRVSLLLFGILLIGTVGAIIQNVDKSVLILTSAHTLALTLIYFTIENPDVKMIQELRKNKRIIEQSNEDKSNFLFRMSQEVKKPVDDILRVSKIINDTDDLNTVKKGVKYIEYNSKELKMIVNDVLDVSKMDTYNIKMIDSTYNAYNLFKELFTRFENTNNKNIQFRHSISKNIPKILYGDSVKIKQVMTTIIQNAFDHTHEGFIDVTVDSITKNDACRLIISISDSGIGMSLDKVNELLSLSEEISDDDVNKLDKMNLDLNIATKIIKLLGGQIIIKSEENVGSEFIIMLEQKIKTQVNDSLEKYNNISLGKKRILIVDDKQKDLDIITNYLKKYDIETIKSMYGDDCVDRINNNQNFDLILIEDEMKPESAINVLQELKKINHFKTPVVVMLDKNKEGIKEHYINDGFNDYLLKDSFLEELDRVIKHII